ncbi:dachshund homolog 1 [Sergentomyia squamirostris]
MSMDSVMDSLSTHSEHSMSSTAESHHPPSATAKTPQSPSNNHHSSREQQNSGNGGVNPSQMHMNRRTPTPHSPGSRQMPSPLSAERPGPQMLGLPHPLSPPQVSTPNSMAGMPPRMAQSLPHLPPHGLGLLNSLQMMHHNPLELMAAAHHHVPPRSYNSPPPISTSDPTANECKLVDYRGQKVAAFIISGDTMLCLPQAFELFLKHLVGGLHTVYTKLKRLDIVPLVCNVEQVRILRGLGAIQPGVNRCKLLSCKDFDVLYRDCTTARYVSKSLIVFVALI